MAAETTDPEGQSKPETAQDAQGENTSPAVVATTDGRGREALRVSYVVGGVVLALAIVLVGMRTVKKSRERT